MAIRRPLVIINGNLQELPMSDTTVQQQMVLLVSQADGQQEPSLVFEYNSNGHLDIIMETQT